METATETLTDVLKELAELAPERFKQAWSGYRLPQNAKQDGHQHWIGNNLDWLDLAMVQVACQEECEARGWLWSINSKPDDAGYYAGIWTGTSRYADGNGDSPALAITTALRKALKAV